MALETLGGIAVALVCLGILRFALRNFLVAYRLGHEGTIKSRERVPDTPMPDELVEIDAAVRELGFVPQRQMQLIFFGQAKPVTIWVYHHPEFHIEIDIGQAQQVPPFWVALETTFADGALLATTYPRGHTVEGTEVLARFAEHSLREAFDHHLLTQFSWTITHGEPEPIPADDEAYFAQGIATVKRHGRTLYAPSIRQARGAGVMMIGVAMFVLFLATQWLMPPSTAMFDFGWLTFSTLLMLFALLLIVGGIGYANRGKKPVAVDADKAPPVDPTLHPLNRPQRTM